MNYNSSLVQTFNILYAERNPENDFNKTLLTLMCKNLSSAFIVCDIIALYRQFKNVNGYFFDIVIIDNSFGLDLFNLIIDINPNQKIIVNIELNNKTNILDFYMHDITNFIYEPLKKDGVNKAILK